MLMYFSGLPGAAFHIFCPASIRKAIDILSTKESYSTNIMCLSDVVNGDPIHVLVFANGNILQASCPFTEHILT